MKLRSPLFSFVNKLLPYWAIAILCLCCNSPSPIDFDSDFTQQLQNAAADIKDTVLYLDVYDTTDSYNPNTRVYYQTNFASVGFLETPEFGVVRSDLFAQLKPARFPFSFPTAKENLVLDSAVLYLRYASMEGDTLAPASISVYEIQDNRFVAGVDKNYQYGNNIIYDKSKKIGTFSKSAYSILREPATYSRTMRIELDKAWSEKFIRQDNTSGYANNDTFNSFFKGFALIAEEGSKRALLHFNLTDTNSRFILYYHYGNTAGASEFVATNLCAFAMEVGRDRKSSLANGAISDRNDNRHFYLQPSPEGSVIMAVPKIEDFWQRKIVHKAEIILEEEPLSSSAGLLFNKPRQLYIDVLQGGESFRRPLPVSLTSTAYTYNFFPSSSNLDFNVLQGYYISSNDFSGYKINITRYMQRLASLQIQALNFKIWAPYLILYNNSSAQRVSYYVAANNIMAQSGISLYGQESGNKKGIRLHIVYSQ